MAKVLKGVIIGALIGFTGGLLAPALVGGLTAITASLGIVGSGVGFLTAAAIGGGILGGALGAVQEFTEIPKIGLGSTISRANLSINPQEPGKIILGTSPLATDVVFSNNHGTNKEFQTFVVAAAAHRIHSYGITYIEDAQITFTSEQAGGDWANTLWKQEKLGTEPQTAIGQIDASDNHAWPTTAKAEGHGHYRLRFRIGEKKTKNGVQTTRITQVAEGLPVYDPRLDTTRGGSGTHRADDQSTWAFYDGSDKIGENWGLQVLTYLIGWRTADGAGDLVWGRGADPDDIDMIQAMSTANVCQETVDGIWRYRTGGILPTSNDHQRIIGEMEAQIGGKVAKVGGRYFIWAPHNDLAGAFSRIDEADDVFVGDAGIEYEPSGSLENLYNTARGRFIDPDEIYQLVPYPQVTEAASVTEDGRERLLVHDMTMVQDSSIAERVTRYLIRRSRFSGTYRFALGPYGLRFQPFDVTTLNCVETNYTDVTVRIINMEYSLSGIVVMEVIEEDASIYDTTAALGTAIPQFDVVDIDRALSIEVAGGVLSDTTITGADGTVLDGIKVAWTAPSPLVKGTEVQYKVNSESLWQEVAATNVEFTEATIAPVLSGTLYNVRVRHISIFGAVSAWFTDSKTSGTAGLIAGVSSTEIADAATNFNDRNDRDASAITAPVIATDGSAIEHIIQTSGDADIIFAWTWTGDEADIDGFFVYTFSDASSSPYNFGVYLVNEETVFQIAADRVGGSATHDHAFKIKGAPANLYYTFGVVAFRFVDADVDADNIIMSIIVQPTIGSEDPYRPIASIAFDGDLTGTVDGVGVAVIKDGAAFAGKRIGMQLNRSSFGGGTNNGEAFLHGFDASGNAAAVAGVIELPEDPAHTMLGTTLERSNVLTNLYASLAGIDRTKLVGYIGYDAGDTTPYTIGASPSNVAFIFQERDGTWKYDPNSGTSVSTHPTITANMYGIGTLELHPTTAEPNNIIQGGSIWGYGIHISQLPFIGPSEDNLNGALRVAVGDGATATWTWDGTYQSPSATTQDIKIVFNDDLGVEKASHTIRFTYNGATDDDDVSGVTQTETGEATTETTHSGGGVNDGFHTIKIAHDDTGVVAFVTGLALSTGGSGGK